MSVLGTASVFLTIYYSTSLESHAVTKIR